MNVQSQSHDFTLEPINNERLANFCGQFNEHLRQVEGRLGVEINHRGNQFRIIGDAEPVRMASKLLKKLYAATARGTLTPRQVHMYLQEVDDKVKAQHAIDVEASNEEHIKEISIRTRRVLVKGNGRNQQRYLGNIQTHDINFGIGPAGTGKTYLAVACAIQALEQEQVHRIVLTRPAVEAGERLGFLPGDLAQKIDPYLRPLYDALYEMLGFERVARLIESNIIEIAPLAYMRGRTLNESFIILDEAQNTTVEQMKMFLTRIGFGSKAVITGDISQVDLPPGKLSGLRHIVDVLKDVEGISFTFFQAKDVVRHPLVQRIVTAYEAYEEQGPRLPQTGKGKA